MGHFLPMLFNVEEGMLRGPQDPKEKALLKWLFTDMKPIDLICVEPRTINQIYVIMRSFPNSMRDQPTFHCIAKGFTIKRNRSQFFCKTF